MAKVKLERWQPHVEAAQIQGVTLAQYAREHGMSKHSLYAARQALSALSAGNADMPPRSAGPVPPFVAVKIPPASPSWRAELPNGVVLHWNAAGEAELASLLHTLATLPCSR